MTLQRKWLLTVVALVAAGIGLEVGVGAGISFFNARYGARAWLTNGRSGAHAALEARMFEDLEAIGVALAERDGAARAFGARDITEIEVALDRHMSPGLKPSWMIVDPTAPRPVRSALAECDGAPAPKVGSRRRAIAWCGATPVMVSLVPIDVGGVARVYLVRPIDEAWADELKRLSLVEIELWGPRGPVVTTLAVQDHGRTTQSLLPADVAALVGPGPERFARVELDLSGAYTGYFPERVEDGYGARLASTGQRRIDAFVLSAPFDDQLGPSDLRVVLAVPADIMLLGPRLAAFAMSGVGLILLVALGFVARRLMAVMSRPLMALEQAARSVAEGRGEFAPTLDDSGSFELSSLRSSFAAMTARVEENKQRAAQSEKMAALGTLAGGVAHEINNPLGVILGFAQGLERRVPDGDPLRMPVRSIVREALRCKSLVQELLTFSRVSKKSDESIDFAAAVRSSLVLLDARAKTQAVEIVAQLDVGLPRVRGSRTQLQQVLVNLGTNALDAMKGGGTLTVSASLKGSEVMLEVADTGHGIPDGIRPRIFEPFFTTKGVGEGTGLGLSLVYQVVQQHHGRIDVAANPGGGTVMRVTLPGQAIEAAA